MGVKAHSSYSKTTTKQKKFLCVGGPYDGEYKTLYQVCEEKYTGFNQSAGYNTGHNMIYVHNTILFEEEP